MHVYIEINYSEMKIIHPLYLLLESLLNAGTGRSLPVACIRERQSTQAVWDNIPILSRPGLAVLLFCSLPGGPDEEEWGGGEAMRAFAAGDQRIIGNKCPSLPACLPDSSFALSHLIMLSWTRTLGQYAYALLHGLEPFLSPHSSSTAQMDCCYHIDNCI